jgi:hypothetical protein
MITGGLDRPVESAPDIDAGQISARSAAVIQLRTVIPYPMLERLPGRPAGGSGVRPDLLGDLSQIQGLRNGAVSAAAARVSERADASPLHQGSA